MSDIQEAVRQWAWYYGGQHPDQEWLCSDYDSWERNPHYKGPPGRHPEDDCYDDAIIDLVETELANQKSQELYADDLRGVFSNMTGLATHL